MRGRQRDGGRGREDEREAVGGRKRRENFHRPTMGRSGGGVARALSLSAAAASFAPALCALAPK